MKRWQRIKLLSGIAVVGMIAANTMATLVVMLRSFRDITRGNDTAEPSDISTLMFVHAVLILFILLAAITWCAAWVRVRDEQIRAQAQSNMPVKPE